MDAIMARKAAELAKPKIRKGKTLASKGKKYKGKGSSSGSPRSEPKGTELRAPAGVEDREVEVLEAGPTPLSSRKREAPQTLASDRAKKGKNAVAEEEAVWRPDWNLSENTSALGDDRLCAVYVCHSVLPRDTKQVAAKEDLELLKGTASSFYQV
jgi:tRNA(Ser,Leu) C12 N-acetylase TAN1